MTSDGSQTEQAQRRRAAVAGTIKQTCRSTFSSAGQHSCFGESSCSQGKLSGQAALQRPTVAIGLKTGLTSWHRRSGTQTCEKWGKDRDAKPFVFEAKKIGTESICDLLLVNGEFRAEAWQGSG